jgi:uncharacterized protein YqcC (DUF446 family)
MTPQRITLVFVSLLWIGVLTVAGIGLHLDFAVVLIVGLVGVLIFRPIFRTPAPYAYRTRRSNMPPAYETVASKIDAIEAEMKRIGYWQDTPLDPAQYDFRAAFAGDTMAFPQWLQFIFIPNVRRIVNERGTFPPSSQVGAYAVREFDTYGAEVSNLTTLLAEFDQLF